MANRSIASRLIWLIASALAGVWLLGSVAAALLTRFEVNERLDNALQEIAQLLMPVVDASYSEPEAMRSLGERMLPALDRRATADQILARPGKIIPRGPRRAGAGWRATNRECTTMRHLGVQSCLRSCPCGPPRHSPGL